MRREGNANVVCLVTDFNVLIDHPRMSFFLPGAFLRPPGEVRHRALDLADLIMEIIPGTVPGRSLIVGFLGPRADSVEVSFQPEGGEDVKAELSDINVTGSNGLTYSYQEYILPPEASKREYAQIGLHVSLALNVSAMQALGPDVSVSSA